MASEAQKYQICKTCNKERKPIQVMGIGKAKIRVECECGIFSKDGKKVNLD